MGIYATDLRECVIRPVLQELNDWSPFAENLLLGSAAHESQLALCLNNAQSSNTSIQGTGIYGIAPCTHIHIWDNYLVKDPDLASCVRGFASQRQFLRFPHQELTTNLSYATAIAWMVYKSNNVQLSVDDDVYALAQCWFDCYRTRSQSEKITCNNEHQEIEKFVENYLALVLCESKKIAA